jgi:hypothetical protein
MHELTIVFLFFVVLRLYACMYSPSTIVAILGYIAFSVLVVRAVRYIEKSS